LDKKKIVKVTKDIFDIYTHDDMSVYIYVEITNKKKMYDDIFDYFFNEITVFDHYKLSNDVLYEPSKRNYKSLYNNLRLFIDDHNIDEYPISMLTSELEILLEEEGILEQKNTDTFYVRNDKAGKIGEYILSILLEKYFDCICIIPKSRLITDRNMSVFGIDTLHYSKSKKMLMFGESKFTKNLDSGIGLIKQSISGYEKQLQEEYVLILSNEFLKLKVINELYENQIGFCMTFEQFLKETETEKIGIPVFITHGEDIDHEKIITKLEKLDRLSFFGVDTLYTIISLPIISKSEILEAFTKRLSDALGEIDGKASE
jgi:hypothetical protein